MKSLVQPFVTGKKTVTRAIKQTNDILASLIKSRSIERHRISIANFCGAIEDLRSPIEEAKAGQNEP